MRTREYALILYVAIMHIALVSIVVLGHHAKPAGLPLFFVIAITPGAILILLVPTPHLYKIQPEIKNILLPLCFVIRDRTIRKSLIGDLTEEYMNFMLPQYGEDIAKKWLRTQVCLTVAGELWKIFTLTIIVEVVKKLFKKISG